jgi:hypothetical protein
MLMVMAVDTHVESFVDTFFSKQLSFKRKLKQSFFILIL